MVQLSDQLQIKMQKNLGGLMGVLAAKPSITTVVFEKNQYRAGEVCCVKLICDNSNCPVPIKSFKIKLKRKVFVSGQID